MVEVVQLLARALGAALRNTRVMLLLDACYIHMGRGFLRACAKRGILVHYVPAKLTWLLQPLDTHAFGRFKLFVGCEYRREIMRRGHCELSAMVRIVALAVRKVLQGVLWSPAFDGNGFGRSQSRVRKTILEVLQRETAIGVSSQLPTLRQFVCMFPRRVTLPLADLLSFHSERPDREPAPVAVVASPAPADAVEPKRSAWHGRLRSSSALSLSCGEASEAEPAAAKLMAIPAGAASSSRDTGGPAPPSPYVERLWVPLGRPRAPPVRKRKSTEG